MSAETLMSTPFGFESTAAEVIGGIDPDRQARGRNRELIGHRHRDREGPRRRGRRRHACRSLGRVARHIDQQRRRDGGTRPAPDTGRRELQFATNHLGHFALAAGLHDALSSAPAGARIVSLSSRGHLPSPVVFKDINFAHRSYEPMLAYGQSKTANVLFAVERAVAG